MEKFSLIPNAVFGDRRLTFEQMRVLCGLYSFCNSERTCWPSRQAIAERTGVHPANISTATTALERLGWVTKAGRGGKSKATRYLLHVPDTLAEQATVAQSATVADSASHTVAESATPPLADSATRIELTSELTSEHTKGRATSCGVPVASLKTEVKQNSRSRSAARSVMTFATWCEEVKAKGERFISDYRPVWEYAQKVGLPEEFVMLAFQVFKDRYTNGEKGKRKTYADWRLAFLNAIKSDWFRLWRVDADGRYCLTSAGLQADLEHRKAA